MKDMRINTCCSVGLRFGAKPALKSGIVDVAHKAQEELSRINKEGKVAGTDSAWWRAEFYDAKKDLERLVKNEFTQVDTFERSSLMSFHDTTEDGFI